MYKIRRNQNNEQFRAEKWRDALGIEDRNDSNVSLYKLMAYGDYPDEVKNILQAELNQNNTQTKMDSPAESIETSLATVTNRLKGLRQEMSNASPFNLCEAVFKMKSDQYDVSVYFLV